MPHDTPLITTIVAALVLAFIFGAIANRLKMPPLVGYLIAGVCVGPHSPGFIADQTLAPQLADIGVILLMFGVGLQFSLKDLLSVKAVAIPGALIRMAVATAMGVCVGLVLHWPLAGGVVFGLALAVSSTVVTLKVLQDRHLVDSDRGRIAMGWLVVEDLAMVLALVLIPVFAGAVGSVPTESAGPPDAFVSLAEQLLHTHLVLWQVIALTVIKLLAFAGFMIIVGRRIIPAILHATAHTGSRELFRLAVLAIALGVAAGAAYLFGVSLALGAFFAGMILSESQLSQRAAQETLPLRDAFGVLFFVSVGMLFDPSIVMRQPLALLATLVIIIFGKSIVGFLLMLLFRRPVTTALTVSASLAQIGEFSFILAAMGVALGVLPPEGQGLILAGAIISIILNPLVFWASESLRPRIEARVPHRMEPELGPVVPGRAEDGSPLPLPATGGVLEEPLQPTSLNQHVVLVGYGRVGSVVAGELARQQIPFVLIEDAEGRVEVARAAGIEVIVGNAATTEVLRAANVMGARCVVIAIPNAFEAGQATEQCRKLNAAAKIIARAHSDEEVNYLGRLGADHVIMGEREIGLGMIDWLRGEERTTLRRDDADGDLPLGPAGSGETVIVPSPPDGEEAAILPAAASASILEDAPAPEPAGAIGPEEATKMLPTAANDTDNPVIAMPPPAPSEPEAPEPQVNVAPPVSIDGGVSDAAATAAVESGMASKLVEPFEATAPDEPAEPVPPVGEPEADAAIPTSESSPVRVIPESELDIIPPPRVPDDDATATGAASPAFSTEPGENDMPATENAIDSAEPEFFPVGTSPSPSYALDAEPLEPEAAEESAWLSTLEHDLFGDSAPASGTEVKPAPTEDPVPVPQPIETPEPQEAPTPPEPEDPVPAPQPIETPTPTEVPSTPGAPPAESPPTRAADTQELADKETEI